MLVLSDPVYETAAIKLSQLLMQQKIWQFSQLERMSLAEV